MSHDPLVSIITPSYNQAAFLEQTIQSVLAQDYPNIEYLVVDGASTDNSLEVIQRYSNRIAWWISEKDSGQAEAINKGFQHAKGEIIAWLNSDDIYLPGAISQAVQHLQTRPELGLVFGDAITMDVGGRPLNRFSFGDWGLAELMQFRIICQPAVFMRRSVLEQAGYLDLSYHYLLDHQLWIRMALEAPIQHVSELWAAARHHQEAKNVSQSAAFGDEALRILEWMQKDPRLAAFFQGNKNHITAGAYRLKARYLLDSDQPAAALRSYMKAFTHWPKFTLQHSHRILYAKLSLLKMNGVLDQLRMKRQSQERTLLTKELISLLEQRNLSPNPTTSTLSWPGIKLEEHQ